MAVYEAKEWTNIWYDEAMDRKSLRAMLIGDSITAGYTIPVNAHLGEGVRADSIAGSKGLDHPFYNEEIDLFARQMGFEYRVIHLNNGLHGFHLSVEEYENLYEQKVRWLMERFPGAPLTLATSTAILEKGPEKRIDPVKNAVVLARNEAVWRIARKYGLPVDDLYSAMLDHPEWRSEDGYHFNEEGRREQGRLIAGFLRTHIE